ncbi:uncharacterized protein NECHADRAFT_56014 [Fusarium vanettenii 77-13-4]|uniref:Cytochrome P450 n=1 Tax=Fusarium vanettenii (strain ATCC MYA-4622 / CBS 123669 / FGSC 9596 / NRRL 45880 / 77-13-4) TaxID=660122 RepID=C7ZQ82_FUSV7|nr:uncharacterized protein NECHADRAFT_56014 [Fusarium vanettenii 77-13-4]EEU33821.1 hypothetical protein NECHADRAFT_56014 [Fusarium vanettenii 77-13-4]
MIAELALQSKTLGLLLVAFGSVLVIAIVFYHVAFSPMRAIPGPWYLRLTSLFVKYHEFHGTRRLWIHDLHLKYGPTVLLAPNEVSFASASALKQIYSSGGTGLPKDHMYSLFKAQGHTNLFTALDNKEVGEKRKQLSERYSNTSILKSPILDVIKERAEAFATECRKTASADVYVALVLERYWPLLQRIYKFLSHKPTKGGKPIDDYVWSSMSKTDYSEFSLMARLLHDKKMPVDAIASECYDHITAGIDTTGDTLCFLLWELSRPSQQERVKRLREELVVGKSSGQPLDTLPYLNAMLQEALRLWAPGMQSLPRNVPAGGREIDGHFVPAGTVVSCQSYTTHRYDDDVFQDADAFVPERWLNPDGDSERGRLFFAFGSGARTCIGRHLAMAEMRALVHAIYSKMRTVPAQDMVASMEFNDQIMTTRPEGLCCKITFEPLTD